MRSKMVQPNHNQMNRDQDGRPQDRRTNGEVILDAPRLRIQFGEQMSIGIEPGQDERFVPRTVIIFEIQVVINQHRAQIRVITNTIAPNPGIYQQECQQEEKKQKSGRRHDARGNSLFPDSSAHDGLSASQRPICPHATHFSIRVRSWPGIPKEKERIRIEFQGFANKMPFINIPVSTN
jgi:hypothetical protein